MSTWGEIAQAEPDFARRVRRLFDAGRHKTIATVRADGSPRISGIECEFTDDNLRFGSMTAARKGADLQRDPRFALHGPTVHPEPDKEREWPGEAKIAGRAVAVGPVTASETSDAPDGELFVGRHHRGRHHPPQRRGHPARRRVLDVRTRAPSGRTGLAPRSARVTPRATRRSGLLPPGYRVRPCRDPKACLGRNAPPCASSSTTNARR